MTSFTFTSELFYIDFSKRGWPWPSSSSSSWPWPWDIENKDFYQRTMKGFSSTEVRLNHSNLYFLPESPEKNIFLMLCFTMLDNVHSKAPFSGLMIGSSISKRFAAFLEENDLFVPDDDDVD